MQQRNTKTKKLFELRVRISRENLPVNINSVQLVMVVADLLHKYFCKWKKIWFYKNEEKKERVANVYRIPAKKKPRQVSKRDFEKL